MLGSLGRAGLPYSPSTLSCPFLSFNERKEQKTTNIMLYLLLTWNYKCNRQATELSESDPLKRSLLGKLHVTLQLRNEKLNRRSPSNPRPYSHQPLFHESGLITR